MKWPTGGKPTAVASAAIAQASEPRRFDMELKDKINKLVYEATRKGKERP